MIVAFWKRMGTFLFIITIRGYSGEGNGNPLQYSCLENPRNRGAWWAAVHGVAQSLSRLKCLSVYQRRKWQVTLVFLPGESQGQRSLMGCCLWGCTEVDTVEATKQQQQQQHSFEIAKIPYKNLFRISKIIFVF